MVAHAVEKDEDEGRVMPRGCVEPQRHNDATLTTRRNDEMQ
ncbi:MAG TPA: hypothetical protein VGC89_22175 [Pyrinomonadaceae bacterium]|jgi:hypothetical protein